MAVDPECAIYIEGIAKVIHLPNRVTLVSASYGNKAGVRECIPDIRVLRCSVAPLFNLHDRSVIGRTTVIVDSLGYIFVINSDTLSNGFRSYPILK